MTDQDHAKIVREAHDWRCDCEWCWLGVTYTPRPERKSILQRALANCGAC